MRTARVVSLATVALLAATPLIPQSRANAAVTLHYDSVWTTDSAANSVSEYAATASDAASPIAVISGGSTLLDAPSAVATDFHGHVFVANAGNSTITEYAPAATGDVAPVAVIGGSKTGLDAPSSLSIAGDQLWVTSPNDDLVEAFSIGTHGNELPAATLAGPKTKLNHPIAVSAGNDGFPEVDVLNAPAGGPSTVTTYFSLDTGNQAPVNSLTVSSSGSVVPSALMSVDLGEDWVVNSSGNALIETLGFGGSTQRLRQIKGSATGLDQPSGISHDAFGRVVVSNAGNHTVEVFSPRAHGNVRPLRVITGVGSTTGQPSSVTVFGAPPAAPTGLTATRHGHKVTLHWHAPAVTGGGVAGYDIDEETGDGEGIGEILIGSATDGPAVDTTKTTVTRRIRPGVRYSFRVVAVNDFGSSSESNGAHVAIVTKPGAPTHVGTLVHHTEMLVTWEPPTRDGGTSHLSYHVQYGTCVPGKAGCHFKTKKSGLPFTFVAGLKKHTRYHVRVVAWNRLGAGKPSPVKTVKVGK